MSPERVVAYFKIMLTSFYEGNKESHKIFCKHLGIPQCVKQPHYLDLYLQGLMITD